MTKQLNKFKNKHKKIFRVIKEFTNSIESGCIVLFGSYAKGTEVLESDIDLLVVSTSKNILKYASTFKIKYALTIRPVVVNPKDFKNIKKENLEFYNDLVEFGIVFYGFEPFFNEVYK